VPFIKTKVVGTALLMMPRLFFAEYFDFEVGCRTFYYIFNV